MAEGLTWHNRCQRCSKLNLTTRQRTFETKNYQGRCGDSFCYASCTLEACRPITVTICDECEKKLKK